MRHDPRKYCFSHDHGNGFGVYDYDTCNRPELCRSCLQQHHLKAECRRLVIERLSKKYQPELFC